jgi:hypothetical protein
LPPKKGEIGGLTFFSIFLWWINRQYPNKLNDRRLVQNMSRRNEEKKNNSRLQSQTASLFPFLILIIIIIIYRIHTLIYNKPWHSNYPRRTRWCWTFSNTFTRTRGRSSSSSRVVISSTISVSFLSWPNECAKKINTPQCRTLRRTHDMIHPTSSSRLLLTNIYYGRREKNSHRTPR